MTITLRAVVGVRCDGTEVMSYRSLKPYGWCYGGSEGAESCPDEADHAKADLKEYEEKLASIKEATVTRRRKGKTHT